jgi:hypothetical protein
VSEESISWKTNREKMNGRSWVRMPARVKRKLGHFFTFPFCFTYAV